MTNFAHNESTFRFSMFVIGLIVAAVCYLHGGKLVDGCELALNHSGVVECHVGPYTGPLPVEFMTVDTSKIIEIR